MLGSACSLVNGILGIAYSQDTWRELTDHRLQVSEDVFSHLRLCPSPPAGVYWAISPSNG
jgi:hypothetical protein